MNSCCVQGTIHSGEPKGRIEKVYGLDCYVAEPSLPAPKAFIVYIPDAFGWSLPNNRLLADTYAKRTGARVYLPEFMGGNGLPAELMPIMLPVMDPSPTWISAIYNKTIPLLRATISVIPRFRGLGDGPCRPRIVSFLSALRADAGDLRIGVAGFCWGGHHAVDLCAGLKSADGKYLIDAGYTAHPSKVKVADFEKVSLPLSVCTGDIDFVFPAEKSREAQKILNAKGDEKKYEFEIVKGAKHGFSIRHDVDNEEEARLAKLAEDQAVAFWSRWIGTLPLES